MNWSHTAEEKTITVQHKWTIDGFNDLKVKQLTSPTFSAAAENKIKWSIQIYPFGDEASDDEDGDEAADEGSNECTIYLHRHGNENPDLPAKFQFSVSNSQSINTFIDTLQCTETFPDSESWGLGVSRTSLLRKLTSDNKLILICDISYKTRITETGHGTEFDVPQCKLRESFGQLLENESFSDITLVVGNVEIKAHKVILVAQSPVFAAMFQHGEFAESMNNLVKIEDIEPNVVKEMLQFLYTGKSPNLETMADNLLAAADKYGIERLKILCEKSLCSLLSVETAARTLYVADLHSATQLKQYVIEYIRANQSVFQTEGWQNVSISKNLLTEFMKGIFNKPVSASSSGLDLN